MIVKIKTNVCVVITIMIFSLSPAAAASDTITHIGKGLSLHKEMYLMPATWASEYHDDETEAVFQISAKQQIFETQFYFAYTQKSFWQAYNTNESSPFRESNYNPEIFYRFSPGYFSRWVAGDNHFINHFGADIGFEHESNGQSLPASRSWNRLYFTPCYSNETLLIQLKLCYRIPEKEKESPDDTEGDDNPDITDYLGYGELNISHQFFDDHLIHLMLRGNGVTKKGAIEVTYSLPVFSGNTFFMLKGFHGYGDSLIDYNHSVSRIGIGIMVAR